MPKVPSYCRQRCAGKADKAYARINGRRHYLGVYGSPESKAKYAALLTDQAIESSAEAAPEPPSDPTISELIVRYLEFAVDFYGEGHPELAHFKTALRSLRKVCGGEPASRFGPKLFKQVREAMVDDNDWSRNYVNDQAQRIKRFAKWCVEEEYMPGGTYHALLSVRGLAKGRTKARETKPVTGVAADVLQATLPHLPAVVADMVQVQRLTGMRAGELVLMRPCDLDRSGEVWFYRPQKHKTESKGKSRVVAIGPKAQTILLSYLARAEDMYMFRPVDSEAKRRAAQHAERKTPLHYGNRPGSKRTAKPKRTAGERYTTASYRRAIHRACDKAFRHPALSQLKPSELTKSQRAELKQWQSQHRWSTHQLRHAAAEDVRREFGLEHCQASLGHAHAAITEVYAAADQRKAEEVARKIG